MEANSSNDIIYDKFGNALKKGQFSTGRNRLSKETGINRSKIERILKTLEIEHQIEQQKNNKCRIITIVNYEQYQESEHQVEHLVSIKRAQNKKYKKYISKDIYNTNMLEQNKIALERDATQKENSNSFAANFPVFDFGGGRFLFSESHLETIDKIRIRLGLSIERVELELKKMEAWLIANPKKAKKDYIKFISNWLSRSMKEKSHD